MSVKPIVRPTGEEIDVMHVKKMSNEALVEALEIIGNSVILNGASRVFVGKLSVPGAQVLEAARRLQVLG